MKGIFVAIRVMNWTLASSGRPAMCKTAGLEPAPGQNGAIAGLQEGRGHSPPNAGTRPRDESDRAAHGWMLVMAPPPCLRPGGRQRAL